VLEEEAKTVVQMLDWDANGERWCWPAMVERTAVEESRAQAMASARR
jgi:hypothetical protein